MKRVKPGLDRTAEFILTVSCTDNADFQGTVEHVSSGQVQEFRSFLELFFLINNKLEETGLPEKTTEIRSWKVDHP